jgi:predicted Ser/Thr protein kinase
MTSTVKHTPDCPGCGRPLAGGALAGLCPACLLAQGRETGDDVDAPPARFQPPSLEEVARLFPQLEIIALLGAGGMGAVYHARQPALDRMVALKVLPAAGRGVDFSERFHREARALARLNHPHIVAVYEFGEAGALRFFIMEYVDGTNLRQLEKARRLSPREALHIIPQICDALQYAHDEGVVHRDIKPENVLVDRRGRVKIADFGLAKISGSDPGGARLTVEGMVMGTPHYMAPEQIERPLEVDHRADIYALGVVLYEMLTGDLPLGKFQPPSRKVEIDVRLDEVVLRALENDPAQRYQQASEVKTKVEHITGSAPVPRRRIITRSHFLITAVLLAGSVAGIVRWRERYAAGPAPVRPAQTASPDASTGSLRADLPGGGTIELLAVAEAGAAPDGWWRPDGVPETRVRYELRNPAESREAGRVSKDLLFRIKDLPDGSDGPFFAADPAAGAGSGGEVYTGGQRMADVWQVRFAWPAETKRATVRAGAAILPWRTIATSGRGPQAGTRQPAPGDPAWRIVFHPPVQNSEGHAQVGIIFSPEDRNWTSRLTAVDDQGKEHTNSHGRGSPIESVMLWTYEFPGLALDRVRDFRLQVRPVHWVEYPGVVLQPLSL